MRSIILAGLLAMTPYGASSGSTDKCTTFRDNLAHEITWDYLQRGVPVDYYVVLQVIDTSQKALPSYFPDGPIKIDHVLAIAACESQFYQMAKGPVGEAGIFQVLNYRSAMKDIGRSGQSPYDVRNNTEMGILILRDKYARYGSLTKTIIAYNGVVPRGDGSWDDTYLKRFRKNHAAMLRLVRKAEEEG